MFFQNLQKIFLIITISATALLVYIWYQDYSFSKNPLNQNIINQLKIKEQKLKLLAYKHFKIKRDFPIIISDKMTSKRFGMAVYDKGSIRIYLNKNRFKENTNYMINDVLPHEYAHAIMFNFGLIKVPNSGHSKKWQFICKKLQGLRCTRFVNHDDIITEKMGIFK